MFERCKLQIAQIDNPDNWKRQKWLQITLQKARYIDLNKSDIDENQAIVRKCVKGYDEIEFVDVSSGSYWGHWDTGENSINGMADTSYTIGGSVPQGQKFWIYWFAHRRLDFVQFAWPTGGGAMDLSKPDPDFTMAMSLDKAWMSHRGIYPLRGSGGSGYSRTQIGPLEDAQGTGRIFNFAGNTFFSSKYSVWWNLEF